MCIQGCEPDTARLRANTPRTAAGVAIWRDGPSWESVQLGVPTDSDLGLPVQDFDRLLGTLQAALAKDPGSGFVFSCLSGQGRTTTAMVVAVLAFWHIRVCVASCVRTGLCPGRVGIWSLGTLAVAGRCGPRAPSHQPWVDGAWAGRPPARAPAVGRAGGGCGLVAMLPVPAAVLP